MAPAGQRAGLRPLVAGIIGAGRWRAGILAFRNAALSDPR